jgi:hypothetical protein
MHTQTVVCSRVALLAMLFLFNLAHVQCTFTNNSAKQFGGAAWVKTNGQFIVEDCVFNENQCPDGAALVLDTSNSVSDTSVATAQQRHLQQQQQQQQQVALPTLPDAKFYITQSLFDNNVAASSGDAIYVVKGVLNITNSAVRNHAQSDHTAIRIDNDDVYISHSVFDKNSGGALSMSSGNTGAVTAHASNFTNNSGEQAAAIINWGAIYLKQVSHGVLRRTHNFLLCGYHLLYVVLLCNMRYVRFIVKRVCLCQQLYCSSNTD